MKKAKERDELASTLVRELVESKMESKHEPSMQVARRVEDAALLPPNTRAAAWERLNVLPLKKVALGITEILPLSTMLEEEEDG